MSLLIGSFVWINTRLMDQFGLTDDEQFSHMIQDRMTLAMNMIERSSRADKVLARRAFMRFSGRQNRMIFVVDEEGNDLFNRVLPRLIERSMNQIESQPAAVSEISPGLYHSAAANQNGQLFHLFALSPHAPALMSFSRIGIVMRLLLALLASAVVSLLLARYLTRPIRMIQGTARQLADGNLDARVGPMGNRRDELADLATDFNSMADQLKTSLHRQQRLLLDVSHELRSPLTRMQVASELARQRLETDQSATKPINGLAELDRIDADIIRLDHLISQTLNLAKHPGIGLVADRLEDTDLAQLIDRVCRRAAVECESAGVTLQLDVADDLILTADPERLDTAIENLLRNAIRHSPAGGSVTVSARIEMGTDHHSAGDQLVIAITDQGPGVPEAELEEIFQPFYRVSTARERATGGAGLGLSIARSAIQDHDGTLIASAAQGGGLCMRIRLPL